MEFYQKIADKKQEGYIRSLVEILLNTNVPTIYLGDITKERRELYFNMQLLTKDNYFETPTNTTVVKHIKNKYKNGGISNGTWTEANGVLFYFDRNMVIALDFHKSKAQDEVILIDSK